MQQARNAGLQRATAGFIIIALAIAILLAWVVGSWWMFFPIVLIGIGGFYTVLGAVARMGEAPVQRGPSSSSYYIFWGPTLVLLGLLWILSAETDFSGVLLLVIFLLWIGAVATFLSLSRKGSAPNN